MQVQPYEQGRWIYTASRRVAGLDPSGDGMVSDHHPSGLTDDVSDQESARSSDLGDHVGGWEPKWAVPGCRRDGMEHRELSRRRRQAACRYGSQQVCR